MIAVVTTNHERALPAGFLDRLRKGLAERNIQQGFDWLDAHCSAFEQLAPAHPQAAAIAGYTAQWVDVGYRSHELIRTLLSRFPERGRASLSVEDFAHLCIAEGILALSTEDLDRAIAWFDTVLAVASHLVDQELTVIAHFGRARCLRRKGEYGAAYTETIAARELAENLDLQGMAAMIRTLESWLVFRKGKLREASQILGASEAVLKKTDDYVALGNIESATGRLAQHEGRYENALQCYIASIDHYRKRDPEHTNIARSLANMAYVERLLSLQMKKKIDSEVASRRGGGSSGAAAQGRLRERFDQLRTSAMSHLRQAGEIYEKRLQYHGAGTVNVNCGFLYYDAGEFDRASGEASEAFELGKQKSDFILMARARLLQCSIENARLEEEIEEEDPGQHARAALDYAHEAVEFAKNTEHTRLLVRAHLAEGLTFANEYFHDTASARAACDTAGALLKTDTNDPLWDELRTLRAKINQSSGPDAMLRAWSQGDVGERTFQQLTEDFAELIIPKVWEQEGRKVSRVATRLSVSPKKVRRILNRAGLLRKQDL